MRNIPKQFDPAAVREIDRRLAEIEANDTARILLAVESGSRAWGFASPDSDYDCRFLYVRPTSDYLRLIPPRDVIETPLDPIFDVNGWDLQKALRLLVKGNAVVIEWLISPLVYRHHEPFHDELLALTRQIVRRDDLIKHYYYQGRIMRDRQLVDPNDVKLKAIFYALRPSLALVWFRQHPDETVAPMNMADLLDGCDLAPALRSEINALVDLKCRTAEMGRGAIPMEIGRFIHAELDAEPPARRSAPISGRDPEIIAAEAFLGRYASFAAQRRPSGE